MSVVLRTRWYIKSSVQRRFFCKIREGRFKLSSYLIDGIKSRRDVSISFAELLEVPVYDLYTTNWHSHFPREPLSAGPLGAKLKNIYRLYDLGMGGGGRGWKYWRMSTRINLLPFSRYYSRKLDLITKIMNLFIHVNVPHVIQTLLSLLYNFNVK